MSHRLELRKLPESRKTHTSAMSRRLVTGGNSNSDSLAAPSERQDELVIAVDVTLI